MKSPTKTDPEVISERLIEAVRKRLAQNKQVRRTLPMQGRLHIDRQLPFLCVYRVPASALDTGTAQLVTGQPSYLIASGHKKLRSSLSELVRSVVETLSPEFGAFLLLEVWEDTETDDGSSIPSQITQGRFQIVGHAHQSSTVDVLESHLRRIEPGQTAADVTRLSQRQIAPQGLSPLLSPDIAQEHHCQVLGLRIYPVYRRVGTQEMLPRVHRVVKHELTHALQHTFFEFAGKQTTHRPRHYHALGRRAVVRAVWDVDQQLSDISNSFDFLLQVSPINSEAVYNSFRRQHCEITPDFHYHPQAFDIPDLKRRLWRVPVERIEDPTLAQIFREKRNELDTQLTMLSNLGTPKFLHGSRMLYGDSSNELLALAEELLDQIPHRKGGGRKEQIVAAAAFADRAQAELDVYRRDWPEMEGKVVVRGDISGLLVSSGKLLIGRRVKILDSRVDALIQHEIGTHLLTYFNGKAQPFRMLAAGLAGYEEMQEGLAVLAEHLVGGLSPFRLRLLAGRVVAVQRLVQGASFVETFRLLNQTYRFNQRTAFAIARRVYRAGGLVKDAIYLRGLVGVLHLIGQGGNLDTLFVGKIAAEHVPVIQELQWRGVLKPAVLRPRYLSLPSAEQAIARLQQNPSVLGLVQSWSDRG